MSSDMTDAPSPSVPKGLRIYAVGDIHGRLDLLDRMHGLISRDAAEAPDRVKHIVYLGDYIDRGNQSHLVLERLCAGPLPGFGVIHLKGNHEDALLRFLADLRIGPHWLGFGGMSTLASYGIRRPSHGTVVERLEAIQVAMRAALPSHHFVFLRSLRLKVTIGDYMFVHAGIRPGVPLDRQRDQDLIWIREEFLNSDRDYGKIIVHGHTITAEPEIRRNRIGIDTGAFTSGRLTCLVLDGAERRFLTTG